MIEVEHLSKSFVGHRAVDDLSFFVPEGQVLGFLGPNGAGKTTAMRMITGFLPPSEGRIVVGGVDADVDSIGLRKQLGYLPENVPLYPEMRVDEYLRFRADLEGLTPAKIAPNRDEVLERCMIGDVRRQIIGTLSKGYRQRVGLAGALIHKPSVLILDEPTVGLDPNQIIKIRELILELGKDHTVLLSTHILPEVEQICERILIIDHGRIVADGTPDALRSRMAGRPTVDISLRGTESETAREALEGLEGVASVEIMSDEDFRLEHEPDRDVRESIFRLVVDRGWLLIGMTPGRASLEDVFVRLTTRDLSGELEA